MHKRLIVSLILILAVIPTTAQVFPYLNASTGNEGQYIVDTDTNVYMFHGSQIEKLDKNFNPIWVKTYSGLDFYSLLLSKTGSIYFIAKDTTNYSVQNSFPTLKYVGKLDQSGNLVWMKVVAHSSLVDINIRQLLLDRNNNLMLSGEAGYLTKDKAVLIKLDTLGVMQLFKYFTMPIASALTNVTILNDSSGYYKCVFTNFAFESVNVATFIYSEPGDSIFSESATYENQQHNSIQRSNYYKSRKEADVFYSIAEHVYPGGSPIYVTIRKYRKDSMMWNKQFTTFSDGYYFINSFDEDDSKNVIFTMSPKNYPYIHISFYNRCFKIDSNGVFGGQYKTLLNYNWWPPSSQQESAKLHVLKHNTYFYDIFAKYFPSNPLSVTYLDSTLTTNCSTTTTLTMWNGVTGNFMSTYSTYSYLTEVDISPYALTNKVVTVATIANFSINPNFCLALSNMEPVKNSSIEIFPNPVHHSLKITTSGIDITEANIFDVAGKKVLSTKNKIEIDVSKLNPGLYFIKIKTDQGEFSKKFIKE